VTALRHAAALCAAALALVPTVQAQAGSAQVAPDAVLLRTPDVSRDQICFRYDGDVWLVDKRGGEARRLSSVPGNESFPRFSPDGQSLAFMGGYEGGSDLYVLSIDGGVPRRLTHHPDSELLCDWLPGGEGLLFFSSMVSGQRRAQKLFTVPIEGGQPVELPVPFGAFGAIDPQGRRLAYTPYAYSEFATWRRYQGGSASDIWILDLATQESTRVTDWPGTDSLPMWDGDRLVFLSDRGEGHRLNLWAVDLDSGAFEQLTDFRDWDVRFPAIGPEDIVFENGGRLWRYELASGESVPVEISIPADRPQLVEHSVEVSELVGGLSLGPNARRAAVEARGELFSVPVEDGVVRNLTRTDGVAERDPAWSPDGRWVAYVSDASGEYEVCVRRSDGRPFRWKDEGDEVVEHRLTSIGPGWKSGLSWAPDSGSLVFCTNDGSLHRLVLDSGELTTLDTSPEGQPFDVDWSPDSRWLAYSHRHSSSRLSAVYLYDLEQGLRHEVTSGMYEDAAPCFDRGGEWLFFRSSRSFRPTYEDNGETWIYAGTQMLMAVPLRADVTNPFAPSSEEEFADEAAEEEPSEEAEGDAAEGHEEHAGEADGDEHEQAGEQAEEGEAQPAQEAEAAGAEAARKGAKPDEGPEPVEIELDGFEARAIALPAEAGRFGQLAGAKGQLAYLRQEAFGGRGGGGRGGGTLALLDLTKPRRKISEQVVLQGVRGFGLTPKGKVGVALADGSFAVIDLAPGQKPERKLDLSDLEMTVEPRREWRQLVRDAGRIMRDFFYDPNMHGVDWDAIVERSVAAVDAATSREDVHWLIGEMISELNVGHAYNQPPPNGLEQGPRARRAGLLGCDWTVDQGRFRIARILRGEPGEPDGRSPLEVPGVDAREGDWLLAVNGVAPDATQDVWAAFEGLAGETVELTLCESPQADGSERRVVVQTLRSEGGLRYRDWVARKRAEVERLSDGRVGYVHVPDTGVNGQNELVRQFMGQMHADALLVDERWNSGGQIPTRFVELLDRPRTNAWAVRHGEDWRWPPVAHVGPKAMLINYASGSGGDCFPYFFRQAGLGKLIGTRTWGGLVGMSGNPALIDGGSITVPRFAFYETDSTWGIEGWGVTPDIEVVEDPALMQDGRDPQLIAGVEQLLAELEADPPSEPQRPPYPDRSGMGIPDEER
jgi:tricorn protease